MNSIETIYRGCRFRSRLEARYAVFFDHAGIDWRYEEQGYQSRTTRWLPDFYLPGLGLHVEVKGPHSPDDFRRIVEVISDRESPWVNGHPEFDRWADYGWGVAPRDGVTFGVLVLGEVPEVRSGSRPRHDVLRSDGGSSTVYASTGYFSVTDWGYGDVQTYLQVAPSGYPDIFPPQDRVVAVGGQLLDMPVLNPLPMVGATHPKVAAAYAAARAARFEHGARP